MKLRKNLLAIVTLLLIGATSPVFADEGISVQPILDNTENNQNTGYFNFNQSPGEIADIVVLISNKSDSPQKVKVAAGKGSTIETGAIVYNLEDKDLPIEKEKVIELKGNEEKEVKLKLTFPNDSFRGEKVYGITVGGADGSALNLEYVYPLVIKGDSVHELESPIKVHGIKEKDNKLVLEIENVSSVIQRDIEVNVKSEDRITNESIVDYENESLTLTPNTKIDLDLNMSNDHEYNLNRAKTNVSVKFNNEEIYKSKNNSYIYIIVIIVILFTSGSYYLILKKKSKD